MGTSGFLKSASIMWARGRMTPAPPAGCSATQREPQVGIQISIATVITTPSTALTQMELNHYPKKNATNCWLRYKLH
jgi:hypothetical protein